VDRLRRVSWSWSVHPSRIPAKPVHPSRIPAKPVHPSRIPAKPVHPPRTLPRSLFVVQGARWGLSAVKGPVPDHTIAIALCWHERTHADPASAAFRELVAAAIRTGASLFGSRR
jgi:hypothetical protein